MRNNSARNAAILCVLSFFVPSLQADWFWVKKEATARASGEQIVAEFTFQNKGDKSAEVKDLKFSCLCLDYTFKSTRAEPKGEGKVLIFLDWPSMEETREVVVFGPQETTPTPLKIQIPSPANLNTNSAKQPANTP